VRSAGELDDRVAASEIGRLGQRHAGGQLKVDVETTPGQFDSANLDLRDLQTQCRKRRVVTFDQLREQLLNQAEDASRGITRLINPWKAADRFETQRHSASPVLQHLAAGLDRRIFHTVFDRL
jgi:hypothetical protein